MPFIFNNAPYHLTDEVIRGQWKVMKGSKFQETEKFFLRWKLQKNDMKPVPVKYRISVKFVAIFSDIPDIIRASYLALFLKSILNTHLTVLSHCNFTR